MEDDLAKAVAVSWRGVSPEVAPSITNPISGPVKTNINFRDEGHRLFAEHNLRSWQSILAPILLIDIDFDEPTITYSAETVSEESKIAVTKYSEVRPVPRIRGNEAFEIFGRAFLGIDVGRDLIEPMAFYRDATLALKAKRPIDAYNGYYLYLESQFCRGRTGTDEATNRLIKCPEFALALQKTVDSLKDDKEFSALKFSEFRKPVVDTRLLTREIVLLRGKLRHHTIGSPVRWNPNKQEHYELEAAFLAMIVQSLAFPRTARIIWGSPYVEEYSKLAVENHQTSDIIVVVTARHSAGIRDHVIPMTVPQKTLDASLARFVVLQAFELVENKMPGAEIFAIRARDKSQNAELFRYDVGPSLPR